MNYLSYYYYSSIFDISFYIILIVVNIIVACIFGAITKSINERKGYYGGFAWGFWLGWIGIIVVACRSDCYYTPTESIIVPKDKIATAHRANDPYVFSDGSWQCRCGRRNAGYVSTCACGINKHQLKAQIAAPQPQAVVTPAAPAPVATAQPVAATTGAPVDEEKNILLLKEYKKLLDDGIITQEEFDAKKKSILSR